MTVPEKIIEYIESIYWTCNIPWHRHRDFRGHSGKYYAIDCINERDKIDEKTRQKEKRYRAIVLYIFEYNITHSEAARRFKMSPTNIWRIVSRELRILYTYHSRRGLDDAPWMELKAKDLYKNASIILEQLRNMYLFYRLNGNGNKEKPE